MRKLIWKEWHEQSWKLAFGCVVLASLAVIGLRARLVADDTMIMWVCFLGLAFLPVLASTGLIPAERAEGTFESLLSLPIASWKILSVKTAMGILLCAVPMIVAAAASVFMAGGREMPTAAILDLYGRSALTALSLFLWMQASTAHLSSEARAGLLGVGILIFWVMATLGLFDASLPKLAKAGSPLAFVYGFNNGFDEGPSLVMVIGVQAVCAAALWALANYQFTAGERRT
jgi:hypothetical protein